MVQGQSSLPPRSSVVKALGSSFSHTLDMWCVLWCVYACVCACVRVLGGREGGGGKGCTFRTFGSFCDQFISKNLLSNVFVLFFSVSSVFGPFLMPIQKKKLTWRCF